jgi:hypothetical protein
VVVTYETLDDPDSKKYFPPNDFPTDFVSWNYDDPVRFESFLMPPV